MDRISLIGQNRLFAQFDPGHIGRLLSQCRAYTESFPDQSLVPSETEKGARIGFLLKGKAAVYSRETVLNRLAPPDCFGVALLYGESRALPTEIVSQGETEILFLNEESFDLLLSDPRFARNLISFLADRIRFLNRKITAFTAPDAERRVAFALSERTRNEKEIRIPSFCALAAELSLGRASLYRALDGLEKEKLIEKRSKTIRILDPEGLKKRSENENGGKKK